MKVSLALAASLLAVGLGAAAAPNLAEARPSGAAAKKSGPLVTFAGLHVHDDASSQLWVEMTEKSEVTISQSGMTLVFLIRGARIGIKNNENPLRAEHFGANVLSAKLDRAKDGVTFTVRLRTATETRYRVLEQADGAVLQVDVPAPLKAGAAG